MEEDLRAAETELQKRHRVAIKAAVDAQRDLQHVQKRELAARLEEALRLETEELEKAWEERAESRGGGAAARGEGAEGGDDGEDEASADLPSASDASADDDATPFALAKLRDELAAARSDSARARDERDASGDGAAATLLTPTWRPCTRRATPPRRKPSGFAGSSTTPRPRERSWNKRRLPGRRLRTLPSRRRVPVRREPPRTSRALLVSPPGTRGRAAAPPRPRARPARPGSRKSPSGFPSSRRRSASRGSGFRARGRPRRFARAVRRARRSGRGARPRARGGAKGGSRFNGSAARTRRVVVRSARDFGARFGVGAGVARGG